MPPILGSISLVLTIVFLSYVLFILVPYIRHKPQAPGDDSAFEWHIFVPCRDEEAVIATTIERQRERFPLAHLWVIDDDSEDITSAIVSSYVGDDPFVHLVQRRLPEARTGKGDALNAAYVQLNRWLPESSDREKIIVAVVDADGEMAANALSAVAAEDCFSNPRVGAAQITVWMKNRADKNPFRDKGRVANWFASILLRLQDIEFRTVILAMQSLRSKTGTVGLGGNGQFTRLSVLDTIAEGYDAPWHGALLEDYELGLHVILAGFENRQVHETYVAQEALPSLRRLITQRSRWSQGNIQCIKYLKDIIQSRHFDAAGVLECFYYLFLPFIQVIGFVIIATIFIGQVVTAITNPVAAQNLLDNIWAIVALWLVFGVAPFAIWAVLYKKRCETDSTWLQTFGWGFGLALWQCYIIISVGRAFGRVIMGRNGWAKTRRNADVYAGGSVAIES